MAIRNASNWEQCTKEGASIWNSNSLRTFSALAAWAVQSNRPPPPPVSLLMRTLRCPLSYCVVQTHLIFRSLSLFSLSRFFRISMNWLKKCSWSFRFWTSRNLWSRPYFSANSLNVVLKDKGFLRHLPRKKEVCFPSTGQASSLGQDSCQLTGWEGLGPDFTHASISGLRSPI